MRAAYFDEDGKQLAPLPKKWLDLSRFKVGDQIRYLRSNLVHMPSEACKASHSYHYNGRKGDCETRDMKGLIGVVVRVNPGDARGYPPRYHAREDVWINQREGWLTVQFPYCNHRNSKGEFQPLALHPSDEGGDWERA